MLKERENHKKTKSEKDKTSNPENINKRGMFKKCNKTQPTGTVKTKTFCKNKRPAGTAGLLAFVDEQKKL